MMCTITFLSKGGHFLEMIFVMHFKEDLDQCYKDYRIDDKYNSGVTLIYPAWCKL